MTAVLQQVRRSIRRHGLCPPGARVLIAVSGGSDSVALTRILMTLAEHGEFTVVGLAHLNHRLRATAERDEAFCHDFAERLRLPLVTQSADVRALAAQERVSLEDAARRVRYAFLDQVASALPADEIAVGHTQDDQAETFLMKLMRGAGLTGLAGIYPRRGRVVRPLLDVSRADLRAYLTGLGERWVEDESNEDLENPRNQIRHRVLPELDRAAGGPTRPAIARAAGLVREDGQWLDDRAEESWRLLATAGPSGVELDAAGLAALPPPIVRRVLLRALRQSAGTREIGLDHVEGVMAVLGGGSGGIDLPGARVELRADKLVLLEQKPVQR